MSHKPTHVEPSQPVALPCTYGLDALAEAEFDRLVRLAADICEVPGALLAFVDGARVRFKCAVGVEVHEASVDASAFRDALLGSELEVVSDVARDAAALALSRALGLDVRFYVVAPLKTTQGRGVGALLVVDTMPRVLGPRCEESLRVLGREMEAKLEAMRLVGELRAERDELLRRLSLGSAGRET